MNALNCIYDGFRSMHVALTMDLSHKISIVQSLSVYCLQGLPEFCASHAICTRSRNQQPETSRWSLQISCSWPKMLAIHWTHASEYACLVVMEKQSEQREDKFNAALMPLKYEERCSLKTLGGDLTIHSLKGEKLINLPELQCDTKKANKYLHLRDT